MHPLNRLIAVGLLSICVAAPAGAEQEATLERATALAANEDFAGAARVFAAVAEAEPENPTAWFSLGRALYQSRQVDRALVAYRKALELGFEPARTMFHLARAHAARGDDAEALDWLGRATDTGTRLYQAIESTPEFRRFKKNPLFREIVEKNRPCNSPGYHQLDFWVGSWRVVTSEGERQVGTDSIQKILNGCAIIENWKNVGGGEGKSLFYYNDDTRIWRQVWITDAQRLQEKQMIAELDGGGVRFQAEIPQPDGTLILDRTTLYPLPEDRVRQVVEQSADGGDTWNVAFDAIYTHE